MRRKYKYRSRQLAEEAQADSARDKLLAEWLLTAWLDNRQVIVGQADGYQIGYVNLRHSALVFMIRTESDGIHRISGIWLSCDDRPS